MDSKKRRNPKGKFSKITIREHQGPEILSLIAMWKKWINRFKNVKKSNLNKKMISIPEIEAKNTLKSNLESVKPLNRPLHTSQMLTITIQPSMNKRKKKGKAMESAKRTNQLLQALQVIQDPEEYKAMSQTETNSRKHHQEERLKLTLIGMSQQLLSNLNMPLLEIKLDNKTQEFQIGIHKNME